MAGPGGSSMSWAYVPDQLCIRYDEDLVSIPNAVRVSARRFGDREAVVDPVTRITFGELEGAMLACVRAMMALGVAPGDRVAVWAPNSARWILAALGIQGAGVCWSRSIPGSRVKRLPTCCVRAVPWLLSWSPISSTTTTSGCFRPLTPGCRC